MYPEGYQGYGTDTGVLVLLNDSTIIPKISGYEGTRTAVQLYQGTAVHMYIYVRRVLRVHDTCQCQVN